jgi:hypothetical protein
MPKNIDERADPLIGEYGRLSPEKLITLKKDAIFARIAYLERVYNEHIHVWPSVYLNPYLLREAVESYYCDVYRLKFFRSVDRINEHKKAAFTMKWLARVRPVQMREGFGPTPSAILVNAYFALMSGISLLEITRCDTRCDAWWKTFIKEMTYLLHYHSPSVETLTQTMCVLKELDATGK